MDIPPYSIINGNRSAHDARCSMLVKDPVSSIEYRASRIEHRGCVFVPVAERLQKISVSSV
ncbi:MAG: hypothetical protein AB1797_08485 [bacterium]